MRVVTLSSTRAAIRCLQSARRVMFSAYALHSGRMLEALAAAASRGAEVRVRLEGSPYGGPGLARENRAALSRLRACGADARAVDTDGTGRDALNMKALVADDALFLDDRNWPDDARDTVVRDGFSSDVRAVASALFEHPARTSGCFAVRRADAVALETKLLYSARPGEDVVVASESFSFSPVAIALAHLARQGVHPRFLVSARDLAGNGRERGTLAWLERAGVDVRAGAGDEKFAVVGKRGWLGSANATQERQTDAQLDWGLRTNKADVVNHLRADFDRQWAAAA
jgi:phospholipase D-like protein